MTVVLGGEGFLGSHLCSRLASDGVRFRTYGRRPSEGRDFGEHVVGDLRDEEALRAALRGAQHVYHLASTSLPSTSNEDPRADVEETLAGGVGLLRACVESGVRTVVFPSSGGTVYAPTTAELVHESDATDPISSYGITKLAFEKYLALFRQLHGLEYRALRIANAYGEGQSGHRPQGLIGAALNRALADEPITIWGDGSTVRDYVYVGDVVDCFIAALQPLDPGAPRVFNVGTSVGHSVREVLAVVESVTGQSLNATYEPQRPCDADRVVVDNARVRDVLGWTPQVDLSDGVGRTWRWLQDRERVA